MIGNSPRGRGGEAMSQRTERRRVHYSGRVQGVGFRFTVHRIAQSHAVTGFVKNLDDGRVELVAEGEAAELDRFLIAIGEHMKRYIRAADTSTSPATGDFKLFEIAY
ncbi:MAG TPA: acylphosphatase [Pirellulaceae bacterium]|nr:acylphosphatase [Pirellulaceae bacterium]